MRKKFSGLFLIVFFFLSLVPGICKIQDNPGDLKNLAGKIDAFVSKLYPADEPGAAVLAKKKGKIILRKGYGMANLELGVPIEPDMIFRLGSITKQFTAAAIMILVEEGKISLQDDITKFFPEYPTKGNHISVEHLLTHTSGIKSYTGMSKWLTLRIKSHKVKELIDVFKNEPMNFKPGEQWNYCNSGYFLLGAIIEKVSGKSYEEFLQKCIFDPLRMKSSYYGNHNKVIPRRIPGYRKTPQGYWNAGYISMANPFSAGALLANVDDLATWTAALNSGKLISKKSLEQMYTPVKLNNGKTFDYGYGFSIGKLKDHPVISHGGGISGFITHALYMPGNDVFVAVLSNCPGKEPAPGYVTQWIAALLIGKPYKVRTAVKLDPKMLDAVVGEYKIADGDFRTVIREGDRLFTRRTRGPKLEVFPESETEFFYKNSFSHFTIVKDKKGKVIKMVMHSIQGDQEAIKIDKKANKK